MKQNQLLSELCTCNHSQMLLWKLIHEKTVCNDLKIDTAVCDDNVEVPSVKPWDNHDSNLTMSDAELQAGVINERMGTDSHVNNEVLSCQSAFVGSVIKEVSRQCVNEVLRNDATRHVTENQHNAEVERSVLMQCGIHEGTEPFEETQFVEENKNNCNIKFKDDIVSTIKPVDETICVNENERTCYSRVENEEMRNVYANQSKTFATDILTTSKEGSVHHDFATFNDLPGVLKLIFS